MGTGGVAQAVASALQAQSRVQTLVPPLQKN
jgi:hypothetical protein